MKNAVPLNNTAHKNVKITPRTSFTDVADKNSIALTVDELSAAASSFPIVFIKDASTGSFHCVALFVFEGTQNLYCSQNNEHWEGVYVPSSMRREPFSLGPDPDQDKTLMIYIDESSAQFSKTDGNALFAEDGTETGFLKSINAQLSEYFNSELLSQNFASTLLEKDLLKEIELLIKFDSERTKRVKGLYTIDEDALNKLDEETVLAFFKQNFFVPIYSMLNSITQFNRLLRLHNNVSSEKIVSLNMRAAGGEKL
ncbi:SapC family protein [Glaciecola sp. SC05]|uniref:SapC family protein n=1 Tax=Glaciecola sp. SC05 TaxID=1987355 RepID=UPI003526E3EF